MWFTVPLLVVVLADRIGRGVAGALMGGAMSFTIGGLAWGVPLLVASGGLGAYLAALGTQAGEDLAAGEMLYLNPNPRAAVAALLRTFVLPWDSPAPWRRRPGARGLRHRPARWCATAGR